MYSQYRLCSLVTRDTWYTVGATRAGSRANAELDQPRGEHTRNDNVVAITPHPHLACTPVSFGGDQVCVGGASEDHVRRSTLQWDGHLLNLLRGDGLPGEYLGINCQGVRPFCAVGCLLGTTCVSVYTQY